VLWGRITYWSTLGKKLKYTCGNVFSPDDDDHDDDHGVENEDDDHDDKNKKSDDK